MSAVEDPGTDVAVTAPADAPVVHAKVEHGSPELLRFVRDLGLAYKAATSLVKTSFVPASYQGKPEEAAAAIITGQGMGLDPLASLRSMDVIQGTPAFRAITIRALVQSRGHEIWVEESNQQRAIVKGRRKGTDKVETSQWDMDRARRLNLAGKPNWKNQPEAMLVARATTEVGRLIAADALLGMAYSIEELEDGAIPTQVAEETKPAARVTRTASRKPREVEAPSEAAGAPTGPTQPDSGDSARCARCGVEPVSEEGAICGPCEDEVQAELEAEAAS